jgi:hypothetical protein
LIFIYKCQLFRQGVYVSHYVIQIEKILKISTVYKFETKKGPQTQEHKGFVWLTKFDFKTPDLVHQGFVHIHLKWFSDLKTADLIYLNYNLFVSN